MLLIVAIFVIGSIIVYFLDETPPDTIFRTNEDVEKALNLNKEEKEIVDRIKSEKNDHTASSGVKYLRESELKDFYINKAYNLVGKQSIIEIGFLLFLSFSIFGILFYEMKINLGWNDDGRCLSYWGTYKNIADKYCDICEFYAYVCNSLIIVAGIAYVLYAVVFLSNESMQKLPETKMFYFCISIMFTAFAAEIILLKYAIFWPEICFLKIRSFFGLCNLWHALFILALIVIVIIAHKYALKHQYLKMIQDKVNDYCFNKSQNKI